MLTLALILVICGVPLCVEKFPYAFLKFSSLFSLDFAIFEILLFLARPLSTELFAF